MPRRNRTSKVVKSTIANKDVLGMFHDVLGTGDGGGGRLNLAVVHPKYVTIERHCRRFVRLLEVYAASTPAVQAPLAAYAASLKAQADATFAAPDLAAAAPPTAQNRLEGDLANYAAVPPEVREAFGAAYRGVKDSSIVSTIIDTCQNLVPHKPSLAKADKLKARFLTQAGLSFAPLSDLPAVNFKELYQQTLYPAGDNAEAKAEAARQQQIILVTLHKMYTISHDVYDAVSAPDIDVNEFVDIVLGSLGDIEKQIPRCGEAIAKIRESVHLLKGNFGGYYKDYVASNNPTIIMENFVLDVSKSTSANARVTAQFRKIIAHYRKQARLQANDPRMKSIFEQVDKNFQELERSEREADAGGGDSDDDSDDAPPDLRTVEELYEEAATAPTGGGGSKGSEGAADDSESAAPATGGTSSSEAEPADKGAGGAKPATEAE